VLARNAIERRFERFLENPTSIRGAMGVIVTATTVVVVAAGVVMHVLDDQEYPTIWVGMWWAIQTVTTVGYGDVVPKDPQGRIVATLVMLEGTAFLAIITASITSTFVARASMARAQAAQIDETSAMDRRFDELERQLAELRHLVAGGPDRPPEAA